MNRRNDLAFTSISASRDAAAVGTSIGRRRVYILPANAARSGDIDRAGRRAPPNDAALPETPHEQDGLCTIDVIELPRQGLVRVRGELDLSNRHLMARALDGLVAGSLAQIVLDVSQLRFVDARSLSSWRMAGESLHAGGRELVVRNPAPFLQRLLGAAGVDQFARVETSERSCARPTW